MSISAINFTGARPSLKTLTVNKDNVLKVLHTDVLFPPDKRNLECMEIIRFASGKSGLNRANLCLARKTILKKYPQLEHFLPMKETSASLSPKPTFDLKF